MKRLKILWLSHLIPYPPVGGTLQRAYHLIKEVSRRHDVYVLAFNQRAQIEPLFESLEIGLKKSGEALSQICADFAYIDIPVDASRHGKKMLALKSLFTKLPYTINWLECESYASKLCDWLCQYEFDVVHYDTISLAPYHNVINGAVSTLGHHNIESIMMIRRAAKQRNPFLKAYYYLEGIKLRHYEKLVCGKFDMNITCSRLDSNRLLDVDKGLQVEVIPNGVDLGYFTNNEDQQLRAELVFAGSLSWYPNLDAMNYFASNIWPVISSAMPEVVMNLIGMNPPDNLVRLGSSDKNFRVLGYVNDVRPYLARASVYVCPIRDGGGTKLKILDALAMGCPIVAHPVAVEGIDVIDGESVLLADSPEMFRDSIKRLLEDAALRSKIATNGRLLVERKYSYVMIGEKLNMIFSNLIS